MRPQTQWLKAALLGFLLFAITSALAAQQPPRRPGGRLPIPFRTASQPRPVAPTPQQPLWIPLPPQHQKAVSDILKFWEQHSDQIERYSCEFRRWEYDPVFGPKNTFKTFSQGVIKYEAPDKGLFEVKTTKHYVAPRGEGQKPQYVERPNTRREHWVSDGKSIYEFDYQKRQLIETILPQELHGKAISQGPLPFLFGASEADIQRRYWIRIITPPEKAKDNKEYWLEAVPKTQQDAANFKMIHIMISGKDFLPEGMVLYFKRADPRFAQEKATYRFENRDVNAIPVEKVILWLREFHKPKKPRGWEHVENKMHAGTGGRVIPAGHSR